MFWTMLPENYNPFFPTVDPLLTCDKINVGAQKQLKS